MRNFFLFLCFVLGFQSFSQNVIELKSDEKFDSEPIEVYLKGSNLYVLNFEQSDPDNMFYILYKVDLETKKVLSKIKINQGKIYKNPYFMEFNDSLYILNRSTFDEFAGYFIFDFNLNTQKYVQDSNIAEYAESHKVPFFNDFKNDIIYIDGKPIKKERGFVYLSLEDKSLYFFEPSYQKRNVSFSKANLESNFKKTYTFKDLPNYENDFAQYNKFRNNTNFFSSKNYIFITPEIGKYALNLENFNVLAFNKADASLVNIGIPKMENFVECTQIKVLSDVQYGIVRNGKKVLIQFGVDKNQTFCFCKSKLIEEHFYSHFLKNYNQKNVYIGSDYEKSNNTKIYFD
nr:hypothetical protein [uncultured Flavobacterium sp.]